MSPTTMGWLLGAIGGIFGIVVVFYAIGAARALGGKIGKAFIKVAIGTILGIIGMYVFGYIHTLTLRGATTGMAGAIGVNIFFIIGYIYMFAGFRGIIASTKA